MADALIPSIDRSYLLPGAIAVAAIVYVFSVLSRPLARVPGPWYSNFTELVLRYHWLAGKRAKYVHALHQKYGTSRKVSGQCSICILVKN